VPEVRVRGLRFYYEEHGAGLPIIGIHGTGSSAVVWARAVGSPQDDHRGATDDAVGVLDALGAAPAVVVGRSYGGEIALEPAWRHPDHVRALVLLEGFHLDPEAERWLEDFTARIRNAAEKRPESVGETTPSATAASPALTSPRFQRSSSRRSWLARRIRRKRSAGSTSACQPRCRTRSMWSSRRARDRPGLIWWS
jgi:pimeloyl-ACP methyl ester carboxylesterase